MTESMTLNFRVEGDFVANICRNLMEERNPHCIRVLMDGMIGMDYTTAYSILSGEKTLSGWSDDEGGVQLVDYEDKEAYQKRLAYQYGGALRLGGIIYRPVAFVDVYNERDMLNVKGQYDRYDPDSRKKFSEQRASYYFHTTDDKTFNLKVPGASPEEKMVIFTPVQWHPDFLPVTTQPAEALKAFFDAGCKLNIYGETQEDQFESQYDADDPTRVMGDDDDEDEDDFVEDTVSRMERVARTIAGMDKPILYPKEDGKHHEYVKLCYDKDDDPNLDWFEVIDGELHDLRGTNLEQDVENFEVVDRTIAKNIDKLDWRGTHIHRHWPEARAGWLSPEAEFFGCDYGGHSVLADMMFNQDQGELEKANWTKIWFGPGDAPPSVLGLVNDTMFICVGEMTAAQKAWLMERKFTFEDWQ